MSCGEISESHRSIHIILKSEKKNVLSNLNNQKRDKLEEFKSSMFAASI